MSATKQTPSAILARPNPTSAFSTSSPSFNPLFSMADEIFSYGFNEPLYVLIKNGNTNMPHQILTLDEARIEFEDNNIKPDIPWKDENINMFMLIELDRLYERYPILLEIE